MKIAIVLIAHGTVEDLDDLPDLLTNIRRGQPPPAELVKEVRRRYETIGGRSPVGDICRAAAAKLEHRLGVVTRVAMRLSKPSPGEVLDQLGRVGVSRVVVVPLAQHSAKIYGVAVRAAAIKIAGEGGPALEVRCAGNWGTTPLLVRAYVEEVKSAILRLPREAEGKTTLLFTAHSLPVAVTRTGDPYEAEVRSSAAAVIAALGERAPEPMIAFQSQGFGADMGAWMGPTVCESLDTIAARGHTHVLVAPIGFLADHLEILYDIDIEARTLAKERGLELSRTRSLNASDSLVEAISEVARPMLEAQ